MMVLRAGLRMELALLVAGFCAVLAWKIVRCVLQWARRREARRALRGGVTAVLRLQMPVASLLVALYYLTRLPPATTSGVLPPVPGFALAGLAGSQLAFLAVLAHGLLRPFGNIRSEGER